MWSPVGDGPERVRNGSRHVRGEEKRFSSRRFNPCSDAPTTSPRERQAHSGTRVAVGSPEDDRSGRRKTETSNPAARDIDACRLTVVANGSPAIRCEMSRGKTMTFSLKSPQPCQERIPSHFPDSQAAGLLSVQGCHHAIRNLPTYHLVI